MKEMTVEHLRGVLLELGDERYEVAAMQTPYHADGYPLRRVPLRAQVDEGTHSPRQRLASR